MLAQDAIKGIAASCGFVGGLLGGWEPSLTILLTVMAADYVSGVIVALMGKSDKSPNGRPNSHAGWKGILKKGMILLVVLVAATLDNAIDGESHMFRDAVCWFYIVNESLSIWENAGRAGIPLPTVFKDMLTRMTKKYGNNPSEDNPDDKDQDPKDPKDPMDPKNP